MPEAARRAARFVAASESPADWRVLCFLAPRLAALGLEILAAATGFGMLPVLFASNNLVPADTWLQCLAPSLRALLSDLGWGFLNLASSPLLIRCLFALSKSCSLDGHSKF
jgi:hypothetical protein